MQIVKRRFTYVVAELENKDVREAVEACASASFNLHPSLFEVFKLQIPIRGSVNLQINER